MIRLYPPVTVKGQSFKGVKVVTVPNQSMTLQDIIKRFIRKESLPIEHNGVYAEGFGDIEKMSREDLTTRHERAAKLGPKLDKAYKEAQAQKGKSESPSLPPTPPPASPPVTPPTTPPPGAAAPPSPTGGT